ncbi:MAG: hypothetical protein HY758_01075 [Nitrospirae bacterium]|nr:hypothetical protein [Nitrospirota bacterium]
MIITCITVICIMLIVQGCASVGNDSLRKESELSVNAKLTEGKTTKAEVKEMFGSPMQTSYTDGGLEIWKYELSKMSADATSFIPVVSLFAASSSGTKKELTILFDGNDVVKKYNMSESPVKVRTGIFNQ